MFFKEIIYYDKDPSWIIGKDNNVFIISSEENPLDNEDIKNVVNEYINSLNTAFVNIIYSLDYNVSQIILNEEKFEEE
jgi:hypothetical protein